MKPYRQSVIRELVERESITSQEQLRSRLRERGIRGTYVYLLEAAGRPFDLVAAFGRAAPTYKDTARPAGLDGTGRSGLRSPPELTSHSAPAVAPSITISANG